MSKGKNIVVSKRADAAEKSQKAGVEHLSRLDGWNNFFTGVGVPGVDRRINTSYSAVSMLPENILRNLYRGDGIAKQIVEIPVEAMMKSGFEVVGDPDDMILARFEETKIIKALENMIRWSRLFGGCLGVIGVDDGQKYEFPLNERNIRNVHYVHVFNRWRVTYTSSDLYEDTRHPKYGQPQWYRISPLFGRPFRVHETRTIRMDGVPVDDLTLSINQGWGDSYLQACFEAIRQLAGVYTSVESIIDDFVTQTLGIKGLADLMKNGKEAVAIKRLEFLDKSRHTINTNLIDADLETFQKVASSLAGIPDALDRFFNQLSAHSRIPVTLFQGMAPAGLNATGDADRSNWHDQVKSWQKKDLQGPIEYLTKLLFLSQDYFFDGVQPENWYIKFKKLWEPTEKEEADLRKVEVETIAVLIDHGIMSEDEARDIPEIRDHYDLVGPAPEPDPLPLLDPTNPAAAELGPDGQPKKKAMDSMPADAKAARTEIIGTTRLQIRDARGRRRADAAQFEEMTLVLYQARFDSAASAAAWVRGHGFKADRMETTQNTFRFQQADAMSFIQGSEKKSFVSPGVEIVMGRPKSGA